MSKKIDKALKELKKALNAHAKVVGSTAVSLKKAQRASSKVSAAASAYADAVTSKSGMGNPFDELLKGGLEQSTITSLTAERDNLAKHATGPVPVQGPSGEPGDTGQSQDEQHP